MPERTSPRHVKFSRSTKKRFRLGRRRVQLSKKKLEMGTPEVRIRIRAEAAIREWKEGGSNVIAALRYRGKERVEIPPYLKTSICAEKTAVVNLKDERLERKDKTGDSALGCCSGVHF